MSVFRTSSPADALRLASPLKPILTRKPAPASVLGTRSRPDSDDDARLKQRTPKRQKTVMFDNQIKEIELAPAQTQSLSQIKARVSAALDHHVKNEDGPVGLSYDELKEKFATDQRGARNESEDGDEELRSRELILYVLALTSYTPKLGRCSGLIQTMFSCAWLERDQNFAQAFVRFLASLASAQGSYLPQVLTILVNKFTQPVSSSIPSAYSGVSPSEATKRVHMGLRHILDLFPAAESILMGILESKFPFTDASKSDHLDYVENLLTLRGYRPALARPILHLILSKVVKLDVEMQLDLEDDGDDTVARVLKSLCSQKIKKEPGTVEESDDGEEAKEAEVNEEDDEDDDSDLDSVAFGDSDLKEARRLSRLKSKVQTLDALLYRLFTLYKPIFAKPDSEEAIDSFRDLLIDFVNIIIVTHKSRHSQFLVFWAAQKSPDFVSTFIGTLLTIALDNTKSVFVRQAAVAYIAGFVSRGRQIGADKVQVVVTCLLDYTTYFQHQFESSCRGPDVHRYPIFYALFQAVVYIFCFRWRDLVLSGSYLLDRDDTSSFFTAELIWIDGLKSKLSRAIYSKLNPLKVCEPMIVDEFASLGRALHLLYIYPKLEINKSVTFAATSSGVGPYAYATGGSLRDAGGGGTDEEQRRGHLLDAHFPFDPYQLPRSGRWLKEDDAYNRWESLPDLHGRDEEEGEEDEEGESDVDSEVECLEGHEEDSWSRGRASSSSSGSAHV